MATQLRGIDVSKHQGTIDWHRVADFGVQFAFIKCSEGVGYVDPKFKQNYSGAKAAGLLRGAYHFARVSRSNAKTIERDAVEEAEWFYRSIPYAIDDMPPVLDIEWDTRADGIKPQDVVSWCEVFCDHLQNLSSKVPLVYTGYNFWRWKLAKTLTLSQYPLWLVNYTSKPAPTRKIPGWVTRFWQYSHTSKVDGIKGNVDANIFFGSLDDLRNISSPIIMPAEPEPVAHLVTGPMPLETWLARSLELLRGIPARSKDA